MIHYLTMIAGRRVGAHFLLAASRKNHIGRGTDCHVVLADPLCSRVHATVLQRDGSWWLVDADSRNGSYVNNQKVDEALLIDGVVVRVGSTRFRFCEAETFPDVNTSVTQTIVRNINPEEWPSFQLSEDEGRGVKNIGALYDLAIQLFSCSDPDDVARQSLELLYEKTPASVVGFLWASDEGQLKPKVVVPADALGAASLSESLTDLVYRKKRAVWIANEQATSNTKSLTHFSDAICAPLIVDDLAIGALHVYLAKGRFQPHDLDLVIALAKLLAAALMRARRQATLEADHQRLVDKNAAFDELLGESEPMQKLKDKISRIAAATGCVLVRGESGVGKELVARALHRASARADRPMLSVNCAAIPSELMESQLFGHKKGAFTGADSDHIGWFQQADSGTLFLDEVGELTLEGQAKLLRILEGHPFLPVGGTKEVTVDVRVIAATNRDLHEVVREKKFREDLYYRLSVFELCIPPLRERGKDIALLLDFFLQHFRQQHGRPKLELADAARKKLLAYSWPGNVRQLRNVLDSAVVMADDHLIQAHDVGLRDVGEPVFDSLRIDDWERKLIRESLKRSGGNVPEAAKLLGLGRATLYRKIEEYGIER